MDEIVEVEIFLVTILFFIMLLMQVIYIHLTQNLLHLQLQHNPQSAPTTTTTTSGI